MYQLQRVGEQLGPGDVRVFAPRPDRRLPDVGVRPCLAARRDVCDLDPVEREARAGGRAVKGFQSDVDAVGCAEVGELEGQGGRGAGGGAVGQPDPVARVVALRRRYGQDRKAKGGGEAYDKSCTWTREKKHTCSSLEPKDRPIS